MSTSSFRRNTKTEQQRKGSGKGPRGNWREQLRMPKTNPTPFVLIKGEYQDPNPDPESIEIDMQTGQPKPTLLAYYKWLKHKLKTISPGGAERYIDEPCSRGYDKHNPKPCAGCQAMDMGDKRITLSEAYSMGVVHLKLYHRVPLFDYKEKQWIMKKDKPSEPVLVDIECQEGQCNFCRALSNQPPILQQNEIWPGYNSQSIQNIFGSRRYLELGSNHLGDIGEWDRQVGSRCGGTAWVKDQAGNYIVDGAGNAIPKGRCNNFLKVDAYVCSHCNTTLIDRNTDTRTPAQLDELVMRKYPCHVCQRPVFLKEVVTCPACGPTQENGGQAKVSGVFDGVVYGQRQGENTSSHLVLVEFATIEDFEQTLHPSIRALYQGKTLRQRIEELSKPYDFAELNKPKDLAAQAKRLEIQVQPQQGWPQQGGPPAQPGFYGQQPQGYPQGAPQQQGWPGGYPQTPTQQPQFPGQPMQQPQYTQYPTQPSGPGPAPFVPPTKPNFG